mgnify:CR=1 FL=1
MAWIMSYQELGEHPKTKRFARLLGIALPTAVGHLHYLWWWALTYAQTGCLNGFTAWEIAEACHWEGDPDKFVEALLNCQIHEFGFLERGEDGTLYLHDWWEHAGRLVQRRIDDAVRKKSARRSANDATDIQETSIGRPSDVERRQHNTTGHDTTVEETRIDESVAPSVAEAGTSVAEEERERALDAAPARLRSSPSKPKPYADEFERWYADYPRKINKQKAYDAFVARVRAGIDIGLLFQARDNYAEHVAREGTEDKYVMYPSTFLGAAARYADYLQRPKATPRPGAEPKGFAGLRAVAATMGVSE